LPSLIAYFSFFLQQTTFFTFEKRALALCKGFKAFPFLMKSENFLLAWYLFIVWARWKSFEPFLPLKLSYKLKS